MERSRHDLRETVAEVIKLCDMSISLTGSHLENKKEAETDTGKVE
jgi:hypothetical protein